MFSSRSLGRILGHETHLKAELFQRTGSFKLRGAINRVASLTREERAAGAVTVSAGNHAQAAALACAEAGVDVVVFMPRWASATKVAATRGYGAAVDLEAGDGAEAFARMHSFAAETGRVVLHPFDDPRVIAGQATVGAGDLRRDPGPRNGDRPGQRRRARIRGRDRRQGAGTAMPDRCGPARGDRHAARHAAAGNRRGRFS